MEHNTQIKKLDEYLELGLTVYEADAVICGDMTLEEALKLHAKKPVNVVLEPVE